MQRAKEKKESVMISLFLAYIPGIEQDKDPKGESTFEGNACLRCLKIGNDISSNLLVSIYWKLIMCQILL